MTTTYKVLPVQYRKTPTDGSGVFSALVSTFGGKPDAQGDVIRPGAFTDTIAEWAARTKQMKLFWQHRYDDPRAAIGWVTRMKQTADGLVVDGQLDLSNPLAMSVYEALLGRTVDSFSIGYSVAPADEEMIGGIRYLKRVALLEISIVQLAANANTELLFVKSAVGADRALQAAHDATLLAGAVCPGEHEPNVATAAHSRVITTPRETFTEPESNEAFLSRLTSKNRAAATFFADRGATKRREAERKTTRAWLDAVALAASTTPPQEVRVDLHYRPHIAGEDAREAEQQARELAALEHQQSQEQAERLQQQAVADARAEHLRQDLEQRPWEAWQGQ